MALVTPPSWLQAGTYPAVSDRLTQQALYATTGIIGSSSLEVTQNSPAGMSVRIASGWAAIVGDVQINQGVYTTFNDATATATITAADTVNPRIDLVCATVRDAYYSGSNNDVIFNVVAGTPASSPVAPATPDNSIVLAQVAVAANASTITTADITDMRVLVTTNLPVTDTLLVTSTSTTSYTPDYGDNGKLIQFTSSSPITVTIPTNTTEAFPVGTNINFVQNGTGQITVVGDTGVTVNSSFGLLSRAQYSLIAVLKVATDTWLLVGDSTP